MCGYFDTPSGGEAVEGLGEGRFSFFLRGGGKLSGGSDGTVPTLFSLGIDHH